VVLAEGGDPRVIRAASEATRAGIAHVTLLGGEEVIRSKAEEAGVDLDDVRLLDPTRAPERERLAQAYVKARRERDLPPQPPASVGDDPVLFGALLVKEGEADGLVAGAVASTAHVVRTSIRVLRVKKGRRTVSSSFLMVVPPGPAGPAERPLLFADCGVVPAPRPRQLAEIAAASAETWQLLTGTEPRLAFVSFSTKGSARHETVDKVLEGLALFRESHPDVAVDGELQVDAALVPEVGESKAPGSPVAGRANVLIFPDLGAGNAAYKLTERLAGAAAVGPLLQGLALPANDLSRGASVDDIVTAVAITVIEAGASG
jgi:phosphate acetyltransferase